jgi:hypothetical protein
MGNDKVIQTEFGFASMPEPEGNIWVSPYWMERLNPDSVTFETFRLALALMHQAYREYKFPVDDEMLALAGSSKRSCKRCLDQLERLGLIKIEWRRKKPPLVTPLLVAVQDAPRSSRE